MVAERRGGGRPWGGVHLPRRRFVLGAAGSVLGALTGAPGSAAPGSAAPGSAAPGSAKQKQGSAAPDAIGGTAGDVAPDGASAEGSPGELRGTEFDLQVESRSVDFTGRPRTATVVNGRLPAPVLRWREGDTVTVRVANRLEVPTSIHWHGVLLPANMDGVPGLSFPGIPPKTTYEYRIAVRQSGTYWYHSHSRFQEQLGLYGAIVIEPRSAPTHRSDREHVILLSDWTDTDPEDLYRTLKRQSDYFNFSRRTAGDFLTDARREGLRAAVADRRMWGAMRMSPTDLSDVSGHAYTYLMNGATPASNWTGLFSRGERVRLRIINGASMTFFDVRIPGLTLTVVATDGQDIAPVEVEELRIGPAEVYDVIVQPGADAAYTIFAQALDRTGFARGTLAVARGLEAPVPPLDPRPLLTMADMGMGGTSDDREPAASARSLPGPNVDAVAADPEFRLDDPGVGLRENGRRVLTYADLHTLGGSLDPRPVEREIQLHLTGHMQRFVWSFDGRKFSEAPPIRFNRGERLRILLVNDSMMLHPIHLHGMWSELESADGAFLVRKHTVVVQPGQKVALRVTAEPPGRWAFHCHLLYHMEAGMFRAVLVA